MVHESFWPTLPFMIPSSPGLHFGFQVLWWVYQIVVMGGVLLILQAVARHRDVDEESRRGEGSASAGSEEEPRRS